MSPTAYRRKVSVGRWCNPSCRSPDATVSETSSTPITKPSFEPTTVYQPGKRPSRAHEAGARTGSIRLAVEKLTSPPGQRPPRPVRTPPNVQLGGGNIKPPQAP